jgi:hypothetical protein
MGTKLSPPRTATMPGLAAAPTLVTRPRASPQQDDGLSHLGLLPLGRVLLKDGRPPHGHQRGWTASTLERG